MPYVRIYINLFTILKIMFYGTWSLKNTHWHSFEQFRAVFRTHRKWQGHHITKTDFFYGKRCDFDGIFRAKKAWKIVFFKLFFINRPIMCHFWRKHGKWDNKWLRGHMAPIFRNLNDDFHKIVKNTLLPDMRHMSGNHIIVSTTL